MYECCKMCLHREYDPILKQGTKYCHLAQRVVAADPLSKARTLPCTDKVGYSQFVYIHQDAIDRGTVVVETEEEE